MTSNHPSSIQYAASGGQEQTIRGSPAEQRSNHRPRTTRQWFPRRENFGRLELSARRYPVQLTSRLFSLPRKSNAKTQILRVEIADIDRGGNTIRSRTK